MYRVTTTVRKGGEAGSVSGAETAAKCWLGGWRQSAREAGSLQPPGCRPQRRSSQGRGGAWGEGGTQGQRWGREDGDGRPKWKRRISSASRQLKITALISLSEITTGLESHCLKQEHRKEKATSTHRVMNSALKKRGKGCAGADPREARLPSGHFSRCLFASFEVSTLHSLGLPRGE